MLRKGFVQLVALVFALFLGCSAVEARLSAPSNVAPVGVSSRAIAVTWADSNANVVGFLVERSKPGVKKGFSQVATINDGAARSWTDNGLASSTTYYYRLRTLQERRNRAGDLVAPRKSSTSKIAGGTTLADAPAPAPTSTPGPAPAGGPAAPWARRFGGTGTDIGTAAAVDTGGNVVVTGRFMNTADFGGGGRTSHGGFDLYVARYAANGAHLWSRGAGGSGEESGNAVAVDPSGNVLVTGSFQGTMNLGGSSLTSAGETDIFVVKYAPDGAHRWSMRFGGSNTDIGYAIGADAAGNVIVAGSFYGTVSLGGSALAASPYAPTDLFVAKYSPDGAHLWSRNYIDTGKAIAYGLAVDRSGNIALTGLFSGSLDFGASPLQSANWTDDAFVAKLSPTGGHVWSRGFGNAGIDYGTAVAMDAAGDVVVTGIHRQAVDFGGGALADSGLGNVFVVKYAGSSGAHRWSRSAGSTLATDAGAGVAMDPDGNPIVVGRFQGTATFGSTSLTASGSGDGFLAKYGSGGTLAWVEKLGGAGDDLGNGVAVSAAGDIVATGAFSGTADLSGAGVTSAGGHDAFAVQLDE
jgi:hypothetical protein